MRAPRSYDHWAWQQRACRALGLILQHAHPDADALPPIDWTVTSTVATVQGTVRPSLSLEEAGMSQLDAFDAWRAALHLPECWQSYNGALGRTVHRALAKDWERSRLGGAVTVLLSAEIDDEPDNIDR